MNNRITEILGTKYPLVQGPMRFITLGEMAAVVSESGGFGQIAGSGLEGDRLRLEIEKARKITDKPVGVNIPVYRPNAEEALEVSIEMGVKTLTTSAGSPFKLIDRIKGAGMKVIHKVSSVRMALKAQEAGVDAVIATGYEAGGHIGQDEITTLCLIPQLVDALDIPVIAAGGIGDARGLIAALALGAEGVEMGTRFVATKECPAADYFKQALINAPESATVVLGKKMPLRVLKNQKTDAITDRTQEAGSGKEKPEDAQKGDAESTIMSSGQIAGMIKDMKSVSEVFPEMIKDAVQITMRLNNLFTE
ncbi:NAD(P)H-dependent flavin oxidoreductase [Thermodesulfobacteriota bacterium]